jgi:hypothetical protein
MDIAPKVGLVVRYGFLWKREAMTGQEEGKDRPCVIALVHEGDDGKTYVQVAPITHSEPQGQTRAAEIPQETKERIGLDDQASWVITNELNRFVWPGSDLRPVREGQWSYGHLPPRTSQAIVQSIAQHHCERSLAITGRGDQASLERFRRQRGPARSDHRGHAKDGDHERER